MRTAELQPFILTPADRRDVLRFLWLDPVRNLYLLWRVAQGALERTDGLEAMLGLRAGVRGPLRAVAGVGANLVPGGDDLAGLQVLGRQAAAWCPPPRMVIGDRAGVGALWTGYASGSPHQVRLDTIHTYYECCRETLRSELRLPDLRSARTGDLEEVQAASAAMLLEDLGRRDQEENPDLFRRRILLAIRRREVFLASRGGQLAFKLNLGARTREAAQLQGVYTLPAHRGQGLGRRGCSEIAHRLIAGRTRVVSLFVREDNAPARRAYEAAGFQAQGQYRMIILAAAEGAS